MRRGATSVLLAAAMAGPAAAGSIWDYSTGMADARVPVGQVAFNIWVHKKRPTFMIEPSMKVALSGGGHFPDPEWRTVAEAFVVPIGCGISDIRPLWRAGAAWEATYVCPAGVNLVALVKEQRTALKQGDQLHLDAEAATVPVPAKP